MFAIYNDEDEVLWIFEDQENAEKCLCIDYENNPSYEVRDFESEEDAVYEVDDEQYMKTPYVFFAVEIEGEIVVAFTDDDEAQGYADDYSQKARNAAADELGYDDDDRLTNEYEVAFQAGFDSGYPEVIRVTPQSGEQYRDCLNVWKSDDDGEDEDDVEDEYDDED